MRMKQGKPLCRQMQLHKESCGPRVAVCINRANAVKLKCSFKRVRRGTQRLIMNQLSFASSRAFFDGPLPAFISAERAVFLSEVAFVQR